MDLQWYVGVDWGKSELIEHERCTGLDLQQDLAEILKIHRTTISREVRLGNTTARSRHRYAQQLVRTKKGITKKHTD